MSIWLFLRPTVIKLAILVAIVSITLLVAIEREATSKVTWNESRGAPFPFLTLVEYRGPCPPLNFCTKVSSHSLRPLALLVDILGWYAVSCILAWGYERMLSQQLHR